MNENEWKNEKRSISICMNGEWTQSHVMQWDAVISYRTGAKIQPMPDWRWHPLTVLASSCWWSFKVHRIIEFMAMDVCCPGFRFHTVGLGEPWRGFATKPLTARVHGKSRVSSLCLVVDSHWIQSRPIIPSKSKQTAHAWCIPSSQQRGLAIHIMLVYEVN